MYLKGLSITERLTSYNREKGGFDTELVGRLELSDNSENILSLKLDSNDIRSIVKIILPKFNDMITEKINLVEKEMEECHRLEAK